MADVTSPMYAIVRVEDGTEVDQFVDVQWILSDAIRAVEDDARDHHNTMRDPNQPAAPFPGVSWSTDFTRADYNGEEEIAWIVTKVNVPIMRSSR